MPSETVTTEPNGEVEHKEHYRRCPLSYCLPPDPYALRQLECVCDQIEANVKRRSEELAKNWLERLAAAKGKGYPRQQLFEEWIMQTLAAITES